MAITKLDELYGLIVFEEETAKAMDAIHPSQLQFNVAKPGLSPAIGPLKQNFVVLENWLSGDAASEYYEEA